MKAIQERGDWNSYWPSRETTINCLVLTTILPNQAYMHIQVKSSSDPICKPLIIEVQRLFYMVAFFFENIDAYHAIRVVRGFHLPRNIRKEDPCWVKYIFSLLYIFSLKIFLFLPLKMFWFNWFCTLFRYSNLSFGSSFLKSNFCDMSYPAE